MPATGKQIDDEAVAQTAAVLRVIGHPVRLRLLMLLMRKKRPVCALAEALSLAHNAVSQHLKLMEARGVVSRRRRGRYVYYEVSHPIAETLIQCMWRHLPKDGGG